MERDLFKASVPEENSISTHTLTWSVTYRLPRYMNINLFQLTRSRGAWPAPTVSRRSSLTFQLTRSRGAWLFLFRRTFRRWYFNSHAHVERDLWRLIASNMCWHFNSHAHVERDSSINDLLFTTTVFQLTRSRGAWPLLPQSITAMTDFNSHAHVERDQAREFISE